MFLSTVLLLFLLQPLYGTQREEERNEKSLYFKKLTFLYDHLGLNGEEIAQRHVLSGLLSDALNAGSKTPREEITIRDVEIVQLTGDGGGGKSFEAKLLTDSLQASLEYHHVTGTVDFASFELALSGVERLEPSSHVTQRSRRVAASHKHTPVNNGSKGIHELLELANDTKCEKDAIFNECKRGSVVMDTWTNQTLAFQRWLQRNLTFDLIQTLGTHNSFNNKADGYGGGDFTLDTILRALSDGDWDFVWAQQWFTMTDQLGLGVRHLMLDPVFFWGRMRLCHCGTAFKWFDDVLHFIEKALNITLQFDSTDLGCMPYDRTLVAGLQEIYDWVSAPDHVEEVVMVHINDERHSADWGHIDLIQDPVAEIFGEILFTPVEKKALFPNRWPTPNELLKLGKRVLATCTSRCNDSSIFLDMHVPDWDRNTAKYFTAAPQCGGFAPGEFYLVGGESQVVGPIYNGPEEEGLVVKENFPYLMQCPVSVSEMDLASPGLVAAAVWSWAPGYSHDNVSTTLCAAVSVEMKGRWVVLSCSTELYHMCQGASNISEVVLSLSQSPWGQAKCPEGYTFSLPQTGYVNWNLLSVSTDANINHAWINLPHKHLPS